MATINAGTIDKAARTSFYRTNKSGGLVKLPFELVTIDHDFQYYEPLSSLRVSPTGETQKGTQAGVVYLDRNMPLPRATRSVDQDKFAVWAYYGV